MESVAPAAAGHQPPGELVDDHDLTVLDHVLDVELEQRVRAQALLDVMEQRHVHRIVEAAGSGREAVREHLLRLRHARFGELHRLVLLVGQVVAGLLEVVALLGLDVALGHRAREEFRDDAIDFVIEVRRFFRRTGDDERRPRFVDQDAVDFVHDRELVPALHEVREVELHVVAQVVEPEFVVRPIGDVAPIGHLPLGVGQLVLNHADRHAEEPVDPAHPLRVAARQVVVDGDDVYALAFEGVQVGGQRRDERLALTGLHLRDAAVVQHHAADELHVEVPHVQHPAAGLADHGEGLGQHLVQARAPGHARLVLGSLAPQVGVRERRDRGLEPVDLGHVGLQTLQFPGVLRADDFREQFVDHAGRSRRGPRALLRARSTQGDSNDSIKRVTNPLATGSVAAKVCGACAQISARGGGAG